jgi:hypothetical protein
MFVVLVPAVAQGPQKVAVAADILRRTCGFAGDAPRIFHAGLGIDNAFHAHAVLPPVAEIVAVEKRRAFLPDWLRSM